MKRVNKDRVVNVSLLLIGLAGLTFSILSNSNKSYVKSEYKETEKVNKEQFAMYIEDDNGNYVEYESNAFPSGYILNKFDSQCVDINNNIMEDALSNVDNSITITSNKTVFCYLYFSVPSLLADIIVELTGQTSGDGTVINENGYRYSGVDPNNYITFNNETWRIIGIVDDYVKIIRNESLGKFSWDYKYGTLGSSGNVDGSNDWTDSQLMMMLNPSEYLKEGYKISNNLVYDSNGKIIYSHMGSYYNSINGYVPASIKPSDTSYNGASVDFSIIGLNGAARELVQENTWYISDPRPQSFFRAPSILYGNERDGQLTYGDNPAIWTGKVGLMYMSDYFYANNAYYKEPSSSTSACANNWMCNGIDEWTMSHNVDYEAGAHYVRTDGSYSSGYNYVSGLLDVRPVLYLKDGIHVKGEGTIDSKYQIIS